MTIPDFPLVLFLLFLSNVDAAPSPPDTWNNVQGFFLIFQTTNRGGNSPRQNNGYNSHNISKFYMMSPYKHPIDIGWDNGYWMLQLIDF